MSLISIVEDLNNALYENNPKLIEEMGIYFSFETDGFVEVVKFLGTNIYNDDEKEWDEEAEDYKEPTYEYLKEKAKNLIKEINKGL